MYVNHRDKGTRQATSPPNPPAAAPDRRPPGRSTLSRAHHVSGVVIAVHAATRPIHALPGACQCGVLIITSKSGIDDRPTITSVANHVRSSARLMRPPGRMGIGAGRVAP